MKRSTFGIALPISLVASVVLGILMRDVWALGIGIAALGGAMGLLARTTDLLPERKAGAWGIAVGVASSLGALIAIQFLTAINTVVSSEDPGELLDFLPIVVGVWFIYVVAATASFAVVARRW